MRNLEIKRLLELYPKIFMACHLEHVRDPKTGKDLSAHQAGILDHLDTVEPVGLLELARHMGVTPSTMSIHTERLVRKGYIGRVRHRVDGRRVNLTLTRSGARIKEAQKVLDPARVDFLLARLSPRERREGLRGLSVLARAAQEVLRLRSERGAWARKAGSADRQKKRGRKT